VSAGDNQHSGLAIGGAAHERYAQAEAQERQEIAKCFHAVLVAVPRLTGKPFLRFTRPGERAKLGCMRLSNFSRRQFLKQSAAISATAAFLPSIIPASAIGADGRAAPSNRVVVGCIGVGPQGQGDMGGFLQQKDVQVAPFATSKPISSKSRSHRSISTTRIATAPPGRFRELLARKDIDACLIATPDHWHVPVAVAAARAGKDMYVEKPMGLTLEEDWALRTACHKYKRVFQFGTQQRSSRLFRFAL